MLKNMFVMFLAGFFAALLTSCSSTKFTKLRTAEEVVENYDKADYKSDGMFLTNGGAVVDVKFEEVKEVKGRLEKEAKDLKEKIDKQRQAIEWLERDNIQMRTKLGLSMDNNAPTGYRGNVPTRVIAAPQSRAMAVPRFDDMDENEEMIEAVLNRDLKQMSGR